MLFVGIADHTVGYGHLSRCLSLAQHASKENLAIVFLLFGDDEAADRVVAAGLKCELHPISELNARFVEANFDQFACYDIILTDFSHPDVFSSLDDAKTILEQLRSRAQRLVLIDAMGDQALAERIPNIPLDILVVPYVGASVPLAKNYLTLAGPAYAVLGGRYHHLPERVVSRTPSRILVSCGGADPTNLTPLVLAGLSRVTRDLQIRIIIGPLFDANLKLKIQACVAESRHAIQLVDSPNGLADMMLWCDLAVTTSGLIKYELAATSTPGIIISIDDVHHRINRAFADSGAIVDLGTKVSPQLIESQVTSVLDNYGARVAMAQAGRRLIDGNGAERVFNEMVRSLYATK
jgi:spore coat polysaccharide biosynthesis predicted glycosyltransferase SpsG